MDFYTAIGISIISTAILTVTVVSFSTNRKILSTQSLLEKSELELREQQKEIHRSESRHLQLTNQVELDHHEKSRLIREKFFNDGFEGGKASSIKDHLIEITNLKSAHREECIKREMEGELRGRSIAKIEHEAQVKSYSIIVKPFVRTITDKGLFKDDFKSEIGYQYQLLVNGIPAFQPHVVIEQSEQIAAVDKETINNLVVLATKCAQIAADTYLAGATGIPGITASATKLGQAVIDQVKV